MKMRLGTKLLASYMLIALLVALVAWLGIDAGNSAEARYNDLLDRSVVVRERLAELSQHVTAGTRDLAWYGVLGTASYISSYEASRTAAAELVTAIVDGMQADALTDKDTAQEAKVLQEIETLSTQYWQLISEHFTDFQTIRGAGSIVSAATVNAAGTVIGPVRRALDAALITLEEYVVEEVDLSRAAIKSADSRSTLITIVIGVAASILAVVIGLVLSNTISRPVRLIADSAAQVANGNLAVPTITVRSGDEIQDLGNAFNTMVGSLRGVIEEIIAAGQTVASSADQLTAASGQTAAAAQQVAQAIGEVASGAGEQSRGSAQVARITHELRQAIEQVATGAQAQSRHVHDTTVTSQRLAEAMNELMQTMAQIRDAANRNGTSAKQGLTVVGDTVSGMDRIRGAVAEAAERLASLDEASRQIGQITQVITDIADQTNLLALNAAIEAARAGEHGRGFAVVADEVRKLAERSANSTREIGTLIANIQSGTTSLAKAMDRSNSEVDAGTKLANESGSVLREVVETTAQTLTMVDEVARVTSDNARSASTTAGSIESMAAIVEESTASAEQMAASADQMTTIVTGVAKVAEDNAATAQEVAASVEEMSASMEEVAASAENLQAISGKLRTMVARFKL